MSVTEQNPVISGSTCPICRKTFKNKFGVEVHYTVVHGKGRKPRKSKDKLEQTKSDSHPSIPNMLVDILSQNSQGMSLDQIIVKLKELGVKQADNSIRSNISHLVRNRPDLGIKRKDRGVYSLSKSLSKPVNKTEPKQEESNSVADSISSNPMILQMRIEQLNGQKEGLIRAIQSLIATMS